MSIYLLLSLLLLSHVLCDFYFQIDKVCEYKKLPAPINYDRFIIAHIFHSFMYALILGVVAFVWLSINGSDIKVASPPRGHLILSVTIVFILFFTHIIIDAFKEFFLAKKSSHGAMLVVVGESLHVSILFWLVLVFFYRPEYLILASPIDRELTTSVIFILAILLLLKPSSIYITAFMRSKKIGLVTDKIQITKSFLAGVYYSDLAKHYGSEVTSASLHQKLEDSKTKADGLIAFLRNSKLEVDSNRAFDSNGAGKWIGYIERVMIFVFILFDQSVAIAAIMAIKTAFRFNDLKDDNDSARSEYIMIGTFLSFFITMVIAGATKFTIKSIWNGNPMSSMDFDILLWLSTNILRG